MIKKVLEAISRYNMFSNSTRVTVALSGGADSVALLYALLSIKDELSLSISAAHLNHCLRGEESKRDEDFVKELCNKLNVPLIVERADIKAQSEKTGESIELCARRVRYEFLERAAQGGLVATAHTASDSAETVLFNLTRGTALKGLCGIPATRDIFVRPLILVTREEIEKYCEDNEISFVTDSSNLSDDYNRNKIRHNVIPHLKGINASFENTIIRTVGILSEDNAFLEQEADELYNKALVECGLNADVLKNSHPALSKRVIMRYLAENNIEISSLNVELILQILSGGKVVLQGNKAFAVKKGVLFEQKNDCTPEFSVEYSVINRSDYEKKEKVNTLLLKNSIDYDKITGEVILRKRMPGDKIRLSGRGVTKTLKKLFTENETELSVRDAIPILADDKGPIWIYGFGVAERVEVDVKTKNILLVKSEIIGG